MIPNSLFSNLKRYICFLGLWILVGQLHAQMSVSVVTTKSCKHADGSATANVTGGTAPYQYSWYCYFPTSNSTRTGQVLNNLPGNTYLTVKVTDSFGLTANSQGSVAPPFSVNVASSPANCPNADGSLSPTIQGGKAPFSFQWDNGATTQNLTNLKAGTYNLTVTDADGCIQTSIEDSIYTVKVVGKSSITATTSATPAVCHNDGSATVLPSGGLAPYQVEWNTIPKQYTETATGIGSGYYTAKITDSQGCSRDQFVQVAKNAKVILNSTYTQSACHDGTITVNASGGKAPYTYYWLTNPVQTTQTATGLNPGYYTVRVTDSDGCDNEDGRYISPSSIISANLTTTDEHCSDQNGTATLSAIAGGMAPYTFQWSNSQTAQSVSNLSYGYYTVVITDANGCDKTKDFHINRNSPVNLSLVSSVQPSCNGSDGSLTVSASGGTAPYTYVWSNGQTTSTASNLNEGGYHVSVKDQGGCSAFLTAWLKEPANCYVNISGQVLNDKNGDCYSDNNERGLAAVLVSCQPYYYTVSDYNGYFNFTRKVGGPFTLSQAPTPYFSQICPANPPYYVLNPAGGSSTFNTFYNQAKVDTNDLGVVIVPVNIPRPGFENRYDIYYYNAGNTVLNGEVTFAHDPALVFTGALPMAQNYNSAAHTASFTFTDLEPHRGGYIRAYTMVPAGTPLGTKLCNDASITPVTGDIYPGNNHYQACHEVTGSYDPNFVEVTPAGAGAPGYISPKDSILSYMIHFQNTGTDTAFTVAVVDTLDPNLNVATFEKGPSSHPCRISIVKGVMTVTFDNILLPDSNIDEKGSHGYISYSVHMKKDRPAGTQIKSKGNIYFDYNIPVVTNEALNTIQYPLGISEARAGVVNISPNPAGSSANVTIKDLNGYYDFTVFDVTGKIVRRIRNSSLNHFELERGSLKSGVYFYKLESGSGTQFGKIVFE